MERLADARAFQGWSTTRGSLAAYHVVFYYVPIEIRKQNADRMNVTFPRVETNVSLQQAKLENSFYNIIDGARVSAGKTLSVINPATGQHLAAIPDVDRALLNKAINGARNAFSGWGAVPFGRRKAILASVLNRIDDHADELSALLTAEQGGFLAQARWEMTCLPKRLDRP